MKNIMIIAPHPDDETLGCGGSLLKHKELGDKIYCIFVTNIDTEHGFSLKQVQNRQKEIEDVAIAYNFDKIFKLNCPTSQLTQNDTPYLINKISAIFKEIMPEIIYLPNKSDVHSDHRIIFEAAYSCTKSFRYPFIKKIMMYETISETDYGYEQDFKPNYFNDISRYIDKKIEIFKIYKTEVQNSPMPRSIENIKALARVRGAASNTFYAESFVILKEINSNPDIE